MSERTDARNGARCLVKRPSRSSILGHSSLETTLNVYTHAIPESQRRAVGKVAKIVFPNVPKFAKTAQSRKVN
jgi:integrase